MKKQKTKNSKSKKKEQKKINEYVPELPLAVQEFAQLRNEGCIYVDKTKKIAELLSSCRVCFLSRPRRFGKSLLVSTLDSLFRGDEKLFNGLYIYNRWNWKKTYNVIRIDFSKISTITNENFMESLIFNLDNIARLEHINLQSKLATDKFGELIERMYESNGKQIVVLIDEYDKPILDRLDGMKETEASIANKDILRNFYGVLKGCNQYLRFVFLTGITRISGLSIFSGLNNMKDISLDDRFCDICGYTQEELEKTFEKYIKEIAHKQNFTYEKTLEEIKRWYNGYTWDGKTAIYNPYSTLSLFECLEFENSWFYSGSPDFLIDYFKKNKIDENIIFENKEIDVDSLRVYDNKARSVYALLFQTGYLTIKKKFRNDLIAQCVLSCPNFEVQYSFGKQILINLADGKDEDAVLQIHNTIKKSIQDLDSEGFAQTLHAAFQNIPNEIMKRDDTGQTERFYHSHLAILLAGNGFKIETEVSSGSGYADLVISCENTRVVCEIKYTNNISKADSKLKQALEQIKDKKYYAKYTLDKNNKIILLGVVFADKGEVVKCGFVALK
jgi:hypothetical protein